MSIFSRFLFLSFFAISLVGCALDPSSESSIKSHLTEENWVILNEGDGWSFCGGCGSYEFHQDGSFIFRKAFNNDGVNEYTGQWNISKTGEIFAEITLNFNTNGEYTKEIGKTVKGKVGETLVLSINYGGGNIEYWNTVNR